MVGQWISALFGLCWMPGLHGHLGLPVACTGLAEALSACMLALDFVLPWISGCPALAWICCCRAPAIWMFGRHALEPCKTLLALVVKESRLFCVFAGFGTALYLRCWMSGRTSLRTPWTSDRGFVHACTGFCAAVKYACTGFGLPFT